MSRLFISPKGVNMLIQSISQNNSSTSFGAHLPRTFAGVMNYMYKNAQKLSPEAFQIHDTVRISSKLKNGKEVNASVNFINGHYIGMLMDEGDEIYRKDLVSTVIEKFKKSMAKGKVKDKLGY